MFPIYGMGILLGPIGKWVDSWIGDRGQIAVKDRIFRHGILDMVLIFFAEYLTGNILEKPWDMSMGLHRADVECRRRDPAGFCSVLVHDRTSL